MLPLLDGIIDGSGAGGGTDPFLSMNTHCCGDDSSLSFFISAAAAPAVLRQVDGNSTVCRDHRS